MSCNKRYIYVNACIDPKKCCGSCHDEWDLGYSEPLEEYVHKGKLTFVFQFCCRQIKTDEYKENFIKEWIEKNKDIANENI